MIKGYEKCSEKQPEKDGEYQVLVESQSDWFPGAFITRMVYIDGRWLQRAGYCVVTVLAWLPGSC